jgi:hypothetical protein
MTVFSLSYPPFLIRRVTIPLYLVQINQAGYKTETEKALCDFKDFQGQKDVF